MSMPKVIAQLMMVKRVSLGKKKVKFSGKVATIVTKAKKKIVIPAEHVLIATSAYCQYLMPTKKSVKGDFEYDAKKKFFICKDEGTRVSPLVLLMAEDKPPLTAKQKKVNKQRADAMKKARESKTDKKSKKKVKVKKKKKK